MTNLDSILKSRDITLPTKVRLVKATFVHLRVSPCAPLQSLSSPEATIPIFIIMAIVSFLEFHVNGIIIECIFMHLASFNQNNIFEIHLCYHLYPF